MPQRFAELTFTEGVRAAQERYGAALVGERLLAADNAQVRIGPDEADFIAERDSFFIATVTSDGWPYVQHRGGPPGFLHVLDPHTVAWAEFRGNRQYITTGNLDPTGPARVAMILIDQANPRRLKLLGHAHIIEIADDPHLVARLAPEGRAKVERAMVVDVEGFTWNCPQHIEPRFTRAEIDEVMRPLVEEVMALRVEVARLRAWGSDGQGSAIG